MNRILLPLIITACLLNFNAFGQDDCNNRLPVAAGIYTVNVIDGTDAPVFICPPNSGGSTLAEWYSFTPIQDTMVTVSTDLPVNTGGDTRFHVYAGTCAFPVCTAGDDDSGSGLLSTATFQADQGVEYLIAFDNRWSTNGFDFEISESAPVVNEVSFSATPISINGSPYCIVDMDGDHLDDVVGVSASNVNMHFQQLGGGFVSTNVPTPQADHPASWSMCAGDLDKNGFTDFLYGSGSGATMMLANANGTAFTEISPSQYIFSQRTNMVDINNDGHLDAFVCHDVDPNVYFINDGFGNFSTNQGGLGDHPSGGNYGSLWTDIDGDHDIDMFISKCGSAPVNELHLNDGTGTFSEVAGSVGLADNVQTWSSSVGDFDNDGDMDIVVGASSTWSGSGHRVMENDNGTFTDVVAGSGFDTFTGTSIEWITKDFNNDGFLDVLGAGALMLGNGDLTFTQSSVVPSNGPIGDLNNDGFLDIQNGNTLYMNNGNSNNYLRIFPVGTVSNIDGIGARIELTTPAGTQIREIRSGEGFKYMSSMAANFGLGSETQVLEVTVYWPSGIVNTVTNPTINTGLEIIEGVSTGVDDLVVSRELTVYPNPADDVLNISSDIELTGNAYGIYSVTGKMVQNGILNMGQMDINSLSPGMYLLQIEFDSGEVQQTQFMKTN